MHISWKRIQYNSVTVVELVNWYMRVDVLTHGFDDLVYGGSY